jgi:hypothetical protein
VLYGKISNIPGKLQKQPQPVYNFDDIVLDIKQKMQTCKQLANERLTKFKKTKRKCGV